jgi:hypothetical protein
MFKNLFLWENALNYLQIGFIHVDISNLKRSEFFGWLLFVFKSPSVLEF